MALKGTLKDFGIADIFQLIGQQQKTGLLHLKNREEEVQVGFKDGNVVRAESSSRKRKDLLGHMLVRSELITEKQLESALEEQKRTLKRVGDVLVQAAAISRERLREMAQLQTTETLYKLFAWKGGDYEFEAGEVDWDQESLTPIRSENVLMEGFRMVDEWPVIRKRISSYRMTFEKLKELPSGDGGGDDPVAGLDEAFGEMEGGEKKEGASEFKNIGANERLVFSLAELGRPVQKLVDLSRLGEFETCKALLNLVNARCLKPVPPEGKAVDDVGFVEGGGFASKARVFLTRSTVTVGLVLAAMLLITRIDLDSVAFGATGPREINDPAAQRAIARSQLSRIEAALKIFMLEKGKAPEALKDLVQAHLLTDDDLRYPWMEPYYYRRTGAETYVLLPPLR